MNFQIPSAAVMLVAVLVITVIGSCLSEKTAVVSNGTKPTAGVDGVQERRPYQYIIRLILKAVANGQDWCRIFGCRAELSRCQDDVCDIAEENYDSCIESLERDVCPADGTCCC